MSFAERGIALSVKDASGGDIAYHWRTVVATLCAGLAKLVHSPPTGVHSDGHETQRGADSPETASNAPGARNISPRRRAWLCGPFSASKSSGSASYESANAIAAVLGLPLSTLRSEPAARAAATRPWFTRHHLLTLMGCLVVAAVVTPPHWRMTLTATVAIWVSCEFAIKTRRSAQSAGHP